MIKILRPFGDTWHEAIGTMLVIILLAPPLLCLAIVITPIILPGYLWDWLRKEPRPIVPDVAGTIHNDTDTKETFDLYIKKAKSLIKDLHVKQVEPDGSIKNFILTTVRTKDIEIELYYDVYIVGFSIDGIRTGYWHSAEEQGLDIFFWFVIAILRYGIFSHRGILGLEEYWIRVDELNVWVKLYRDRPAVVQKSFSLYRVPPKSVTEKFLLVINSDLKADDICGVSKNIRDDSIQPLNGLRHKTSDGNSGWFIWRGEYTDEDDFFETSHVGHLIGTVPINLLFLEPGYRFLVDTSTGHTDTWFDKKLSS